MLGTQPKIHYLHYDYIKIRKILFAHLFFLCENVDYERKGYMHSSTHTYTHTQKKHSDAKLAKPSSQLLTPRIIYQFLWIHCWNGAYLFFHSQKDRFKHLLCYRKNAESLWQYIVSQSHNSVSRVGRMKVLCS